MKDIKTIVFAFSTMLFTIGMIAVFFISYQKSVVIFGASILGFMLTVNIQEKL